MKVVDKHIDRLEDVITAMGTEGAKDIPEDIVAEATEALETLFGVDARDKEDTGVLPRKLHSKLIYAMTRDAQDPDDVLHQWTSGATPLGIEREIPTRGIFPQRKQELVVPHVS